MPRSLLKVFDILVGLVGAPIAEAEYLPKYQFHQHSEFYYVLPHLLIPVIIFITKFILLQYLLLFFDLHFFMQ